MEFKTITPNETMQVHELLNLKTVCMTTSKLMEGIVFDQDLKALLEKDAQQTIREITDLQSLLKKAPVLGKEEK